jgi:hypothetical protein
LGCNNMATTHSNEDPVNVAGTTELPAGASLTITLSLSQQQALSWAVGFALDDRAHYLKHADPEVDYGAEWPEVAVANGNHLDNLAAVCEKLSEFGAAGDCRQLASGFREAADAEPDGNDLSSASEIETATTE